MQIVCRSLTCPTPVPFPPGPEPSGGSGGGATLLTMAYRARTNSQAVADPGVGGVAWNTVAQTNATKLMIAAIGDNAADGGNVWRSSWVIGKTLAIQNKTDSTQIQRFTVTAVVDHTTWFEVSVTPGPSSGAPFVGNNQVVVALY